MNPRRTVLPLAIAVVAATPAAAHARTYEIVSVTHSSTVSKTDAHYRGTFAGSATSDVPGNCALTAPSGSTAYPAVAPGLVTLTVGPDPNGTRRTLAAFIGQQATLGNPYFGSECSTDLTGEPTADDGELLPVSRKLFTRRKVTLRFHGSSSEAGIVARWSTVFRLVRVG